jgi:hypothetical protein
MLKNIFGVLFFAFIYTTTNATTKSDTPIPTSGSQSFQHLYKFKAKSVNEIEYWWIPGTDGCFRLYRLEIIGGVIEIWTSLGYLNYTGITTNCAYSQEQMETMC